MPDSGADPAALGGGGAARVQPSSRRRQRTACVHDILWKVPGRTPEARRPTHGSRSIDAHRQSPVCDERNSVIQTTGKTDAKAMTIGRPDETARCSPVCHPDATDIPAEVLPESDPGACSITRPRRRGRRGASRHGSPRGAGIALGGDPRPHGQADTNGSGHRTLHGQRNFVV